MSSPPVPDPYLALGVSKDATQAQVKTVYRKLALKYHPDKVTDDALKASAADNFHRIQQAYEILGDEERRSRYDAQIKLMELRRDVMERQQNKPDVRTAAFEVPTSSQGRTAFTARGPERMTEERKPSKTYTFDDGDYFGTARPSPVSRKTSEYGREYRNHARDEPEKVKVYAKENEKSRREERRKTSDRDRGRARDERRRPAYVESDSDSDPSEFSRTRRYEDGGEKDQYFAKRHASDDYYRDNDRSRKFSSALDDARGYISRNKGTRAEDERPSASRKSSTKDPYVEVRRERPSNVRRSSARPSTTIREERRSPRDRKYSEPEVEYTEPRTKPTLQTSNSSPASIKVPESRESRRAHTMQAQYDKPEFTTPHYRRSETMPTFNSKESASRRKDPTVPLVSSKLRPTEFNDGIPTPSASPDYDSPPEQYSTKYRVADDTGINNGRRATVLDTASIRTRYHSPEPIDRERDRDSDRDRTDRKGRAASSRSYAAPPAPPPLRTSATYAGTSNAGSRPSPVHRHASEHVPLYGEVPSPSTPGATTRRYEYPDSRDKAKDIDRERERLERDVQRDRGSGREREKDDYKYSIDPSKIRYTQKIDPDSFTMQSGSHNQSSSKRSRPAMPRRYMSVF